MLHFGKNPKKFGQNLAKKSAKIVANFANFVLTKSANERMVQRSESCRSRRELSKEYLLAKFGFDPAENDPDFSLI